ncbi:flagellar hook-length control protein FliK [Shewanella sp. 202IG2-18]|uniref:flagellar hook-length control protein FliK n=1 Tax=Parashewanella hymeniacidonis TaxID=2807618 RepID=UPI0019603439|nr:flagellar hook-length control protein FliK [Parashewanella hymeniacidonis]MBM7071519.1 flagellar hook-length control protein FliK [Parashewanella hymeniacidonis]
MTILNTLQAGSTSSSSISGNGKATQSNARFSLIDETTQSELSHQSELGSIYSFQGEEAQALTALTDSVTYSHNENTEESALNTTGVNVTQAKIQSDENEMSRFQQANIYDAKYAKESTVAQSISTGMNPIMNLPNRVANIEAEQLNQTQQHQARSSLDLSKKAFSLPESSGIKSDTLLSQMMHQGVLRSAPQLAQQNQLHIQSIVSELSNIENASSQVSSIHSQAMASAKSSQWGPIPINTAQALPHQSQQLMGPLREQVRFQIDQNVKQAEIRLDPPELGKLDMSVKLDGDRLQIQLNAATAQVRDALQAGIERLRSDLALDHGGQVDVNISYGEHESEQHQAEDVQIIASFDEAESEMQPTVSSELDVRA